MSQKFKNAIVGISTFVIAWFLLSYLFFPVELIAPPSEYFHETMTYMMPLKFIISLIFTLLSVFLCEQSTKSHKHSEKHQHSV